jgi:hypothetical protein
VCIVNAASERDMAVFASGMIQACFVAPCLIYFFIISNSYQVYDSMSVWFSSTFLIYYYFNLTG